MGFFGTYLFESGRWFEAEEPREANEPWLFVNIYDSDITTVMYRPSGPGTGMAFLGVTPRSYFDVETASAPTDIELEADGLASWWALLNPEASPTDRTQKRHELQQFLAPDTDPYGDLSEAATDDEADEAEIFVEIKTGRFLAVLGLPLPNDLRAR